MNQTSETTGRGKFLPPRKVEYTRAPLRYIDRNNPQPLQSLPMQKLTKDDSSSTVSTHIEPNTVTSKGLRPTVPIYADPPNVRKIQLEKNNHAVSFDLLPPAKKKLSGYTTNIQATETEVKEDEGLNPQPRLLPRASEIQSQNLYEPEVFSGSLAPQVGIPEGHFKKPLFLFSRRFLFMAATAVFLVGIGLGIKGFVMNDRAAEQVKAATSSRDDERRSSDSPRVPSEEPLTETESTVMHKVALNAPRTLEIPKLGVNSRVFSLGVTEANEIDTPKNIYDTAWYKGSAKPGGVGATVINGYVSGPTKAGVFKNIRTLAPNDELVLERGDGKRLVYVVKSVESMDVSKVDMNKLLNTSELGRPGLNLITCAGKYDYANNRYEDRTIVYSVLR